jgi:hypothetical protein
MYRTVLFYSRSNVIPKFNDKDPVRQTFYPTNQQIYTQLVAQPNFYFDTLFLHSKASKTCDPQAVFDRLSDATPGYCMESSTSFSKLLINLASLIPHPATRPQEQAQWKPATLK